MSKNQIFKKTKSSLIPGLRFAADKSIEQPLRYLKTQRQTANRWTREITKHCIKQTQGIKEYLNSYMY